MPLQTVEELRYVKHKIKRMYGQYGEAVIAAEYVAVVGQQQQQLKERLFVLGKHRIYIFRKAKLQSNLAKDYHLYDLVDFACVEKESFMMRFRKGKGLLAQVIVHSAKAPMLVQNIRQVYARITCGYSVELMCNMQLKEEVLLPIEEPGYPVAGGLVEAYKAQCSYFKAPFSNDLVRLIELIESRDEYDLDLSLCPQVENAKVMLPLVGALRHNTYFLSVNISACKGSQNVLLMLANVIRFNTTMTKLDMASLNSPSSFQVFGASLTANEAHAIQVLDLSCNKIPSAGVEAIAVALESFNHGIVSLSLRNCGLSKKSLLQLFMSFKENYGMSMSIECLDLSQNRLGRRGSHRLASWMNMVRDASHLRRLYLSATALSFADVGRPLVHFKQLEALDLSCNRLDHASVQLLTLFLETSLAINTLNVSQCGLSGEWAGKILATLLTNAAVSDVRVHMDCNSLLRDEDVGFLCAGLRRGSNVHTLTLSGNKFKATELIRVLDALQQHHRLHTLVLDKAYRGSKQAHANEAVARALAMLVNQNANIKALSLAKGYGDVLCSFFDHFATNSSLLELDVSRNLGKDLAASSIASALRGNCTLRYLELDANSISLTGWQAVAQILSVNHTLLDMPFPWADYQRCASALPQEKRLALRRLLNDIQDMLSRNRTTSSPRDRCTALKQKYTIVTEVPTPRTVKPLATLPQEMPEEISGDTDTNFTFADDSSDEDETEMELQELQDNFRRFSTMDVAAAFYSDDEEEETDVFTAGDDDLDEDPNDPFVASVQEVMQRHSGLPKPPADREASPVLQQPVLVVPQRPPLPAAMPQPMQVPMQVPQEQAPTPPPAAAPPPVTFPTAAVPSPPGAQAATPPATGKAPVAAIPPAAVVAPSPARASMVSPPPPPPSANASPAAGMASPAKKKEAASPALLQEKEFASIGELLLLSMGERRESLAEDDEDDEPSDDDDFAFSSDEEDDW
mmetsp:Transcript_15762/g.61575  ORF Transcript_15762/g.61575 Transcript_15762/m.61575 type:complete len:971 (-) Transcript_15762:53-2965(-)